MTSAWSSPFSSAVAVAAAAAATAAAAAAAAAFSSKFLALANRFSPKTKEGGFDEEEEGASSEVLAVSDDDADDEGGGGGESEVIVAAAAAAALGASAASAVAAVASLAASEDEDPTGMSDLLRGRKAAGLVESLSLCVASFAWSNGGGLVIRLDSLLCLSPWKSGRRLWSEEAEEAEDAEEAEETDDVAIDEDPNLVGARMGAFSCSLGAPPAEGAEDAEEDEEDILEVEEEPLEFPGDHGKGDYHWLADEAEVVAPFCCLLATVPQQHQHERTSDKRGGGEKGEVA